MNKVFLSGNLTRDPEVRYTQTGKAFSRFGIAINRRYKDKDSVEFFDLVAWEKTAEFSGKYLHKGSRVLVEGRLQTSSYENRDGVKVKAVEIVIENIEFASSKRAGDDNGYSDNDYPSDRADSDYPARREQTPAKRKDPDYGGYGNGDFKGELIDENDTPF